jgi:5'-3' exonuclease
MINLIFDGNNLFHKSLYVYTKVSKGPMLGNEQDKAMFLRKNATDLAYTVRKFTSLKRVIVTFDHSSWRKKVKIDENDGYKANRVKDESTVDWTEFNNVMEDFTRILRERNIIVSVIYSAEGDDLMYLWAEKLLEAGEDSFIISGDRDMSQCVKFKDGHFIALFDNKSTAKKLFLTQDILDFTQNDNSEISPENILFAMSDFGSSMDDLKSIMEESEVNIVDPEKILYTKIMTGDGGDNVPSIHTWPKQQKGKTVNARLTEKRADRILEILESEHGKIDVYDLYDYAESISKAIEITLKHDVSPTLIDERIRRNIILMRLDKSVIPQDIITTFDTEYLEVKDNGHPNVEKLTMQSILEGSKYYDGDMSFEADIFAKTKKHEKKTTKSKTELF